ncbi:MAG: hypothetical protein ABI885_01255 [Gammaproteobacteria bacterium]
MLVLTVGTSPRLIRDLWSRIGTRGGYRFSHLVHPGVARHSVAQDLDPESLHFFREELSDPLPAPDPQLLASLEKGPVPTIHNMIMSDRFVSGVDYSEGLAYATLLTRRLLAVYAATRPTLVIGGFDGLHGALGFAVARLVSIPWFTLYFSGLPYEQACFCSTLSPASRVPLDRRGAGELRREAESLLGDFEARRAQSALYVPPKLLSPSFILRQVPTQLTSLRRVLHRRKQQRYLKYTDYRSSYSIGGMVHEAFRLRKNLYQLRRQRLLSCPIEGRYAFFGLHMQPESSIDVFAHFFSNQLRVVELMSRSLPPTHALLVKLHKSDALNYPRERLAQLANFPGVKLVSPYADSREFVDKADLIFSIQGTMGFESAMLGKPVIMFGDSPVKIFPSVATIGRTIDLPELVRAKLAEAPPARDSIVTALMAYLRPLHPASGNDWNVRPTDEQIDAYVKLFAMLQDYVQGEAVNRAAESR